MQKCKDAKESSVLILEENDYICYHSAITSVEKKKTNCHVVSLVVCYRTKALGKLYFCTIFIL